MARKETPFPEHDKKFLFDLHNFDEGHKEEPEENLPPPPPPPPTFSEDELAAAQKESHAKGRREGFSEAAASREKHVAGVLDKISQNFATLFAAEESRAALYEREAVSLAKTIFAQIFPALNRREGIAEIQNTIAEVLKTHRDKPQIIVEVHPDYVDSIREFIDKSLNKQADAGSCIITGNESLGPADCKMSWDEGGSARNAGIIAEKIHKVIEQTLADRAFLRDNKEGISSLPSGQAHPDTDNGDKA